jgi:flavodoxin I
MQIGLFYGSSSGDTERVAFLIRDKIGSDKITVHNIAESKAEDMNNYPFLIFGIPTWGIGKLQDDWEIFIHDFRTSDCKGKKIAMFGLGDQESYPDTFADALGILYDIVINAGCKVVGDWPVSDYNYFSSKAEIRGRFVGLVLDERNQPGLTNERVNLWIRQLGITDRI